MVCDATFDPIGHGLLGAVQVDHCLPFVPLSALLDRVSPNSKSSINLLISNIAGREGKSGRMSPDYLLYLIHLRYLFISPYTSLYIILSLISPMGLPDPLRLLFLELPRTLPKHITSAVLFSKLSGSIKNVICLIINIENEMIHVIKAVKSKKALFYHIFLNFHTFVQLFNKF